MEQPSLNRWSDLQRHLTPIYCKCLLTHLHYMQPWDSFPCSLTWTHEPNDVHDGRVGQRLTRDLSSPQHVSNLTAPQSFKTWGLLPARSVQSEQSFRMRGGTFLRTSRKVQLPLCGTYGITVPTHKKDKYNFIPPLSSYLTRI